jgi:hypothetical protein
MNFRESPKGEVRRIPLLRTRVNRARGRVAEPHTELQCLHETNGSIDNFHSDLCWWAMEGYYDPQLTIDVDCLFFAAFRARFADYERVLATDNGNCCFFPSVLRASPHFLMKYLCSVEANHHVGCGL